MGIKFVCDLFKPWRRKIGVVTLLLALVFTGGWVRSWTTEDLIEFTSDESWTWIIIFSDKGSLSLQVDRLVPTQPPIWSIPKWHNDVTHIGQQADDPMIYFFRGCGFAFGSEPRTLYFPDGHLDLWVISYYAIVAPLTVFSAYLLIAKSPKNANTDL